MPHNRIIPHKLTLQGKGFEIPVADITHRLPGPTILITGGMDGDEYTGIGAAYELIEYYSKNKFEGRIIIVPIVNMPGFYDTKSLNPLDGKYPKYIFPGSKNGTATEQLIDWLNTNFLTDTSLWIDLHSGAITERMRPFVWGWETRNKKMNAELLSILTSLNTDLVVFEKARFLSKADRLASKNCMYMVFEAGEKGEQKKEEIDRLVSWTKNVINAVPGGKIKEKDIPVYEKVAFYTAPFDGMWVPHVDIGSIEKGKIAGTLMSVDGSKKQTIAVKESGEILWMKGALSTKKGDELVVVAFK